MKFNREKFDDAHDYFLSSADLLNFASKEGVSPDFVDPEKAAAAVKIATGAIVGATDVNTTAQ